VQKFFIDKFIQSDMVVPSQIEGGITMSQIQHKVTLTPEQCQHLQSILDTGFHTAQQRKRAKVLLLANDGLSDPAIAAITQMSLGGIYQIRRRCCEHGLDACVTEKPRSGRPRAIQGPDEAALTALACSQPPEGHVRWTHRLLADRLVELELVDDIAHTTVGRTLKKTS
jgi:transposase